MDSGVIELVDRESASTFVDRRVPLNLPSLIRNADVVFFGDIHVDYAITQFMIDSIKHFKQSGVTSVGLEINPQHQVIFDEINRGEFTNIEKISWSTSMVVQQKRIELIKALHKSGITVYPFAQWEGGAYTEQAEMIAAKRIQMEGNNGKTIVLVGAEHIAYQEDRPHHAFPHTADQVQDLGIQIKRYNFAGGMNFPPFEKFDEGLLQRVLRGKKLIKPEYIDQQNNRLKSMSCDGIIVLPEAPFIPANHLP